LQVADQQNGGVEKLLTANGFSKFERITYREGTGLTVVYFRTTSDAMKCHESMLGVQSEGSPISVAYRELTEPSLLLENIPETHYNEAAIMQLFARYKPSYVELGSGSSAEGSNSRRAVLVVETEDRLNAAVAGMNHLELGEGHKISVKRNTCTDFGLELSLNTQLVGTKSGENNAGSVEKVEALVRQALDRAGVSSELRGLQMESNVSAHVSFLTQQQVRSKTCFELFLVSSMLGRELRRKVTSHEMRRSWVGGERVQGPVSFRRISPQLRWK
jgi:hypothetical protein